MNEQSINEQYNTIRSFLEQNRLKEAVTQLESFVCQCPNWDLRMRLEQLNTSYKYMLDYMKQGIKDPERWTLHDKMTAEAWEIADQTKILLCDKVSSKHYHELRRDPELKRIANNAAEKQILHELESFKDNLAINELVSPTKTTEILERHRETMKKLFNLTWTNCAWTVEEEENAYSLLHSELIPAEDINLIVGGVTLSLMDCFDIKKICWLMDAYRHTQIAVQQRALVGLLITCHIYRQRIQFYPELNKRMEVLKEIPDFSKDTICIYKQMLLCQETEKINKKMQEEIIPEMLKNASNIKNMRFGLEENEEENNDINPDWQDAFSNPELENKLREMSALQQEGADVHMSTFASLKSYPFFYPVANWFCTFNKLQPEVYTSTTGKGPNKSSLLDFILDSGFFCNSDKFSLFFTIYQLPAAQQEMMLSQLDEQQMSELAEKSNLENLKKFNERSSTFSNQYLHDLYRFFKLSQHRRDFRDIFKEKLDLHHLSLFTDILTKNDVLFPIANFYLAKERWQEAIDIFSELEILGVEDGQAAEFYQKLGFAFQKTKAYEEAIQAYRKADALKPDNVWNNRHLATCYRLIRQYKEALTYYRKVEEVQPEDTQVIFHIGNCLAKMKQYDEALNYFFKLDFNEKNSIKAWRGIGWCSFICRKYEQAIRYYQKVIENKPLAIDYMNCGHVAWAMGNIQEAVTYYGKSITADGSRERFIDSFRKDRQALIEQGIPEKDIPLLLDLL